MSLGLLSFIIFDVIALAVCIVWIYLLLKKKKPSGDPELEPVGNHDDEHVERGNDLDTDDLIVESDPDLDAADILKDERNLLAGVLSGLEKKAVVLSDLKDSIKVHLASLITIRPSDKNIAAKDADTRSITDDKIDLLVSQTQHSNQLIEQLKADFDNSQKQLQILSRKLAEKGPDVNKVRQLIERHRCLKSQSTELKKQLVEQEAVCDTQQLLIEELQHKVGSGQIYSDGESGPGQLEELQTALARTLKEKEFIESHYLDLVETLPDAEEIKEELERTRKELLMLEEHIVNLDTEEQKA